ncbi:SMI1/KNR4 family protein [Armatimonas rosea]|uniref:Knr4/Smi1-like domain-containing protein n=1 Tax=Armatimonas rosea TaxID=685828 RepID=A0A7W9SNV9_ARMRO|nr:SMI1/KNR4 family protein [Armatimonas rosea]MBB6049319.1 hypothetical protein [Armatimonas rosea]
MPGDLDMLSIFEQLLTDLEPHGLSRSHLNPGLTAPPDTPVPPELLALHQRYDGMSNEAFYGFRLYGLYHWYPLATLIQLYHHDISRRDLCPADPDLLESPVPASALFPFLYDDSYCYCIAMDGNNRGKIYHLDEEGTISEEATSLTEFLHLQREELKNRSHPLF